MNVLLIDDEPIEIEQLEILIHSYYPMWRILKAQNGSQAANLANEAKEQNVEIQLAFIDIKLPGKSGLEVASQLRLVFPNIDIIIVSAFQDFEYAKHSIHLGVVDYLVKPVIERELVDLLTKYVEDNPQYLIGSELVNNVIDLVKNNYKSPLKLSSIAAKLHVNPNYLSRLFSEEMGVAFSDYLIHYRIEMAKTLLAKRKSWSIQRVAEETGFNSQHYFSTTFRKITNQTPKAYRNASSI